MEGHVSELEGLLAAWLPRQRWFAGKGRELAGVRIVQDVPLGGRLRHIIAEARYADTGPPESYQVPLVLRPDAPFGHDGFLLGQCAGGLVYDGPHDPDGSAALLELIRSGRPRDGLVPRPLVELGVHPAHAVGTEQSNTSIVYGETYILKVFRRLWPGPNPDLEITTALADAGSRHVARPLAHLSGVVDGTPTTFAFMQEYLRSGTEGWRLALTSVRDLYNELDLHADEVGGDFAGESARLGAATARVHATLAAVLPTAAGDAATAAAEAAAMHSRLDEALKAVEELRPYEDGLRRVFDVFARRTEPFTLQRIHGDLHLGQVLRVETGWVLFDFEGEPAKPVAERVQLASPLRDVAGMLRSFDYAARSLLMESSGPPALAYRAREWSERNQDAFCRGYGTAVGRDPRLDEDALRAFEVDKAVYEVLYEARHRPAWLPIPLGCLGRLAGRPAGRLASPE